MALRQCTCVHSAPAPHDSQKPARDLLATPPHAACVLCSHRTARSAAQPTKTPDALSCAAVPDLPAYTPGLACWDIYKAAPLDALKPKPQAAPGVDGVEASVLRTTGSTKASRVQHATHSAGKLPASFSSNSPKEQKMLAYLADFQRVFQELYPHRWVQTLSCCPCRDMMSQLYSVPTGCVTFAGQPVAAPVRAHPSLSTRQRHHIVRGLTAADDRCLWLPPTSAGCTSSSAPPCTRACRPTRSCTHWRAAPCLCPNSSHTSRWSTRYIRPHTCPARYQCWHGRLQTRLMPPWCCARCCWVLGTTRLWSWAMPQHMSRSTTRAKWSCPLLCCSSRSSRGRDRRSKQALLGGQHPCSAAARVLRWRPAALTQPPVSSDVHCRQGACSRQEAVSHRACFPTHIRA